MDFEKIIGADSGATFHRADLHVHSYGGSADVSDENMTVENILSCARDEGLSMISVTDHNEIDNSVAACSINSENLLVIPGVELSTPQGHLLCYLPTSERLKRFFASLNIADRGEENARCQDSMFGCLEQLASLNGFAILAHVDGGKGLEQEVPGYPTHKSDVLCHMSLLGLELKSAHSDISFSPGDPVPERRLIGEDRKKRLVLGTRQYLARTLFSDSHSLSALGKNAQGDRKITRFKMSEISFGALRIALRDADARVRIEDEIPESVPKVIGIHLNGGFLAGQTFRFSSNLTCIIGGRGTGKSTSFECVKCCSENGSDAPIVDSDAWPVSLTFVWRDEAGEDHHLERLKESTICNMSDPEFGPCCFPIECHSQGATARTMERLGDDPASFLHFLDQFVDIEQEIQEEEHVRENLLTNQTEIEKMQELVSTTVSVQTRHSQTQGQLKALAKHDVKDIVEKQRKLAEERQIRLSIVDCLSSLQGCSVDEELLSHSTRLEGLTQVDDLLIGKIEFSGIRDATIKLRQHAEKQTEENYEAIGAHTKSVEQLLEAWKNKEGPLREEIQEKIDELEKQGLTPDTSLIKKLANDEAEYKKRLDELCARAEDLKRLKVERKSLIIARWEA